MFSATTSWGTLALQGAGVVLAYEALRHVLLSAARRKWRASASAFVRRHNIQLESARFIDRVWVRESLAQDPRIDEAIAHLARETGTTVRELRERADHYVEEIAPFFSLSAYYRFGASFARRFVDFCFEMVVEEGGFEEQMACVPEGAVRVYVINHRANIDPVILAYGLLRHVPMSYAVGEWALVWPLHTLFRAFGSYFVRRGEKDPLYHLVLERFIQTIASEGAVTGFFIEGGLSRDGALRRPRTGLLDYIIRLRCDHPDRQIVFLPVGLNYDRVFEDRILTRDLQGPLPQPTAIERAINLVGLGFWVPQLLVANLFKLATRSHRKFGYAAVQFGEPLCLHDWPGGEQLHTLPDEARREAMSALAEELLYRRVGDVIPATPVSILCEALHRPGASSDHAITRRVREVIAALRAKEVPLGFGRAFHALRARRGAHDEGILEVEEAEKVVVLAVSALLKRRLVRRVLTPQGRGVEVVDGASVLIDYYANSIRHHL